MTTPKSLKTSPDSKTTQMMATNSSSASASTAQMIATNSSSASASTAQILVTNSSSASASTAIECNGFAHDCCNHIFLLLYMCQTLIRFLSSFMLVWCALLIASARCICAAKLARPAVYQTVIVHVVPQHALIVVVAALRSRCAC